VPTGKFLGTSEGAAVEDAGDVSVAVLGVSLSAGEEPPVVVVVVEGELLCQMSVYR
jgi:hypothetical protein